MYTDLIERNINNCVEYNQNRENIRTVEDRRYILEVDGICPLCGDSLIDKRKGAGVKQYEIAHIYPNSPTKEDLVALKNVNVLGTNSEDFQNKIAICKKCHNKYDYRKNVDEYNNLLNKKKTLYTRQLAKEALAECNMNERLFALMNKITSLDVELIGQELRMQPIEIKRKFGSDEKLLKAKINEFVAAYYKIIKQYFKELSEAKQLDFDEVATAVRAAYKKIANLNQKKSEVLAELKKWILSKTGSDDEVACEIFISYFVQNCEVFDEITE